MKDEKNLSVQRQEEIFRNIFLGNMIILILLLLLNVVEKEFIMERAINIFSFWIMLFLIIFVPRRILRKSKKYRYLILYIRKKYPKIFYYYLRTIPINEWMFVFFEVTKFYLGRILRYLLVGTKVKKLKPYKENWEKGEFILMIILEVYRWIQYIYLYVYKLIYEIILFFDTAPIYKIIRSRILGFMMVTIGYIILGMNFFLIYVLSWIIGFFIYTGGHIYINYKRKKTKNYDLKELEKILILLGYYNYIIFIYIKIEKLKKKTVILTQPITFWKNFYYDSVKRKYGAKEATKCLISTASLISVRKDNLNYISKKEAEEKKIEYICISTNKFLTDFHLKRIWYRKANSIWENRLEDSYVNTIFWANQIPNLYFFYLRFVSDILSCFVIEEKELNEVNEKECIKKFNAFWNQETKEGKYYFGYLKEFFEFKEIYEFVKLIEEKKKELGFEGFKKKLKELDYFIITYNVYNLYREDILNEDEIRFLDFEFVILFLEALDIKYDKNQYKEVCVYLYEENYDSYKEKITKKIQENIINEEEPH